MVTSQLFCNPSKIKLYYSLILWQKMLLGLKSLITKFLVFELSCSSFNTFYGEVIYKRNLVLKWQLGIILYLIKWTIKRNALKVSLNCYIYYTRSSNNCSGKCVHNFLCCFAEIIDKQWKGKTLTTGHTTTVFYFLSVISAISLKKILPTDNTTHSLSLSLSL